MDENIREITQKIENGIKAELGVELGAFRANSNYVSGLTSEQKSEIIARSRKIIKADQLSELSGVIDLLSDKAADHQNKFYILIDKLDEHWVDESIII